MSDTEEQLGQLTPEEREIAQTWYEDKIRPSGKGCPMCGHEGFILLNHMVSPQIVDRSGKPIYNTGGYPHLMLACGNCSTIQFVNAVKAGVAEGEE